jgi:hypothetical protein
MEKKPNKRIEHWKLKEGKHFPMNLKARLRIYRDKSEVGHLDASMKQPISDGTLLRYYERIPDEN